MGPSLEQPVPLSDLLAIRLERSPNEAALLSLEGNASWSELDRMASRLAASYVALGLKPGDRFASLMPNRIALIAHYLACFKAGLVATPLNYRYMAPEIDHAFQVSGASALLTHGERLGDLAATKAGTLPLGVITYRADKRGWPELREPRRGRTSCRHASRHGYRRAGGDLLHLRQHRSSQGGDPYQGLARLDVRERGEVLQSRPRRRGLAGFVLLAYRRLHLCALRAFGGRPRRCGESFDHDELGPLFRQTRPTLMSMLPTALLHLLREHDMTADELSSLRLCRSAGDKVPEEFAKEYMTLTGHPISEGYGMTKIGLAALHPPTESGKLGSVGVPSPGFVFSIRTEEGNEAASGEDGRLFVRTPSRTAGYWNDPNASAEVIREEWLDTGDMMRADEDGYLWFCGRKKQIIVHDGSNICPQEVEEALLAHPAVESVGVVGLHDLVHGENVRAYVSLKPDAPRPKSLDLIKFAKARVGYKAPEEVVFLKAMPLNATGKVDRVALKKLAAGDHSHHR